MTVEVNARREALLCLHRAILAVEHNDIHSAELCTLSAVAWLRDISHSPSTGLLK